MGYVNIPQRYSPVYADDVDFEITLTCPLFIGTIVLTQ